MDKLKRRQLIKGGAAGTLALGAFAAGASAASADEGRGRGIAIHIHGLVGGVLAISMDVAGRPNDLAGAGWDSGLTNAGTTDPLVPGPGPASGDPSGTAGPMGACYYTAAGRLVGDVVTLKGRSLLTNRAWSADGSGSEDSEDPQKSDTRADGRTLDATANVKTGLITFSLTAPGVTPGVPLSGFGTVMVFHGGRAAKDDD